MANRRVQAGDTFERGRLSGSSGLSKAFPSLDDPSYVGPADANHVRADDEIIGVYYQGRARAYPTWVARHHHLINDTWGDERLLVDT